MNMSSNFKKDPSLENLLLMSSEIFPMDNGYWTKIEAYEVKPDEHIPHGIRYSLTLHNKNNQRVLGFDNAHAYKPRKKKYGGHKIAWDHKHKEEQVDPYEFETAGQLLEDFWKAVEQTIKSHSQVKK